MNKDILKKMYLVGRLSVAQISGKLKCSEHKINYWIKKYNIPKRTISEAIYQINNPNGDPFFFNKPEKPEDIFLFGLGLGLFWGEGTKRGRHALRLCNSDPVLVRKFIEFLIEIYNIDKNRLRFQIQTYDDLNTDKLLSFWRKKLSVKKSQFYKTIVLVRRGRGTYREKMKYGVIVVNFNNMKLKSLICSQIANMT